MSELGSLYIKLGEPEGELCGCTCEVGDWAAKHIVDLTEQRDKLLAALEGLANDIHSLIHESSGGRFERLTHLPIALEAIAAAKAGA
jgi:hypothetical protein